LATTEKTLAELITGAYDYHPPERGDIRQGVLLSVEKDKALVDMGVKREGIVPKRDLELLGEEAVTELAAGDEVAVYVMSPEDQEGNLLVSLNRAKQEADWTRAQELLESGETWQGEVVGCNRGGLLVSFGHLRGFVPASHVAELRRGLSQEQKKERLAEFTGEKLPLKVIEIERHRRRLILSNRQAVRAWRRKQRRRLLEELTEGAVVHGTVSSLCDFGAFVDLGGADGLIHISELAWHRVKRSSEVLEEGREVEVYVLRVDRERERIGLSLKRLQPDPWSLLEDKYSPGDVVEGEVTNVVDFGAFVRVEGGVEGLVHVSEMFDGFSPEQAVSKGERVLVRVLRVDAARKRMGLSLRDVSVGDAEESMGQQDEAGEALPGGEVELSAAAKQADEEEGDSEGSEVAPGVGYATPERIWDRLLPAVASLTMGER
jgi:small subunit ribosomal protein S1